MSDYLRLMRDGIWLAPQGEGVRAGAPSVFVRTAGCELRCAWCDSPSSLPDYDHQLQQFGAITQKAEEVRVIDAYDRIIAARTHNCMSFDVVFTGGEPMLQSSPLDQLAAMLAREFDGHSKPPLHLTIESNGEHAPIPWGQSLKETTSMISLSPKVARWDRAKRVINEVTRQWLGTPIQLKIVVASKADIDTALEMFRSLPSTARGMQLEYGWMKEGWLPQRERHVLFQRLAELGACLWTQTHKQLGVR